jgi:hypothetical protein
MVFALSERDEQALADALRPGGTFCALLPPGSAAAALAWAVARGPHRPLIWITDGPKTLDGFFHDLQSLAGPHAADLAFYPAWESLPGHGAPPPADLLGDRLETLQRLGSRRPPLLVATCVQALMQRTLAPDLLRAQTLELATGRELDLATLTPELEAAGFSFQAEVHQKGEVAVRGGIVDLWPAVSAWPIRVELFGSAIESMRAFDPATQKSQFKVERLNLAPAREDPERLHGTLFDHVPAGAAWAWHERESIAHHAALYEEVIGEADGEACTLDFDAVQAEVRRHGGPRVELVSAEERPGEAHRLDFEPVDGTPGLSGTAFQPDLLEEQRRQFVQRLNERARAGWQVHIRFGTTGALDRFREAYGPQLAARRRLPRRGGRAGGRVPVSAPARAGAGGGGLLRAPQGDARPLRPARPPPRPAPHAGRAHRGLERPAAGRLRGARRPRHRQVPRPLRNRVQRAAPGGADPGVRGEGQAVPAGRADPPAQPLRRPRQAAAAAAHAGRQTLAAREGGGAAGGAGPGRAAAADAGGARRPARDTPSAPTPRGSTSSRPPSLTRRRRTRSRPSST